MLKKLIWITIMVFLAGFASAAYAQLQPASAKEEMVTCSCCGKEIKKADAKAFEYKGKTYYFSSDACKEAFAKEPEKFFKTVYTCSMCPDVKSDKPGKCPKCGMELQKTEVMAAACQKKAEGKEPCAGHKEMGKEAAAVKTEALASDVQKDKAKGCCEEKANCPMAKKKEVAEKK